MSVSDAEYDALLIDRDRLKIAVQLHHDQRGDSRCWLDDLKLYHDALGIGPDPYVTALPPRDDFLASCRRYYDQRQAPEVAGTATLPACMTIAQLTGEVERLRADEASVGPPAVGGGDAGGRR